MQQGQKRRSWLRSLLAWTLAAHAVCVPVVSGGLGSVTAGVQEGLPATPFETIPLDPKDMVLRSPWKGPAARIIVDKTGWQRPQIEIRDGDEIITSPLLMLGVSAGFTGEEGSWPRLLYQIDLAKAHGVKVVEVVWANGSVKFLRKVITELGDRGMYLVLRVHLWIPETADMPVEEIHNLGADGVERPTLAARSFSVKTREGKDVWVPYNPVRSPEWVQTQKRAITGFLNDLNEICDVEETAKCRYAPLARWVVGLRWGFGSGGEWFFQPLTPVSATDQERAQGLPDPSYVMMDEARGDRTPWGNPEAYWWGDYSEGTRRAFQRWSVFHGYPDSVVPPLKERLSARLGTAFSLPYGTPGEAEGAAAVRYRQFRAEQMAAQITEIFQHGQTLTDGRSLALPYAGYTFGLGPLGGGVFANLEHLMGSSGVDAIVAPYSYGAARRSGEALVPNGPINSGEVGIFEDDRRPFWNVLGTAVERGGSIPKTPEEARERLWNSKMGKGAGPAILALGQGGGDPFAAVQSPDVWLEGMKRDVAAALLAGRGINLFDLFNKGWFGLCVNQDGRCVPQYADIYADLWSWLRSIATMKPCMPRSGKPYVKPQILILVDEGSLDLHPESGLAGEDSYLAGADFYLRQVEAIAKLGAPVRYHLLSDLGKMDVSEFKFVVFLNAWKLTSAQRALIQEKLGTGRTLLFTYAAGLYGDDNRADVANIQALTNVPVGLELGRRTMESVMWGRPYGSGALIAPSFHTEGGAAVFVDPPGANSMYIASPAAPGESRVVYSAHPILEPVILETLAHDAGVHLLAPGTAVEGLGSDFIVHRGGDGAPASSPMPTRLSLSENPVDLYERTKEGGFTLVCGGCTSHTLLPAQQNLPGSEWADTRVFQIRPPGGQCGRASGPSMASP